MNKIASIILVFASISLTTPTYAIGWVELANALLKIANVNTDILNANKQEIIQFKEMNEHLYGTHTYGRRYYDSDGYSWGGSSWQDVLALSKNGGAVGQLEKTVQTLAKEYPIQGSFNSPNEIERAYYRLQAQTALAARSAAEVSYQQAVKQEKNMHKLHDLIDQVEDEKSASDLNNRFASEQAMTSLQQTKLLSILVQQQAVAAQARANRAKEDMEFFEG